MTSKGAIVGYAGKVIRRGSAALLGAALMFGIGGVPAHAETWPVKISVKADAKLSKAKIKVKKSVTGTAKINFNANAVGIPLPARGYYVNSFPLTVGRPSLKSANAPLDSNRYAHQYNTYLSKTQWEVRGARDFLGKLSVKITGSAKGVKKGSAYFYSGTYTCGGSCINDHAIVKLKVVK